MQKDGALDSLNLELGTIAAASPKAGLELGALLRQPSVEGSTGAREVLKRSMAGEVLGFCQRRLCGFHLAVVVNFSPLCPDLKLFFLHCSVFPYADNAR